MRDLTTGQRRQAYDDIRTDLSWLTESVLQNLQEWTGGAAALDLFGTETDSLDVLFLMSAYAAEVPYVLWQQVQDALADGASWNAIAAALGVSRQAAKKRFG